jgi:hypothetical protein
VPGPADLAVAAVAAAGVALIVLGPAARLDGVGVLAAVGANVSFATGVVLTKRFAAPVNQLGATGWQLLLSGVILVPLVALVEGAPPALTTGNIIGFAYLSLVATGLAFVMWFRGIRRLPISVPPLLGLAAPVTGAVLGWALLGQALSALQVLGFVVTIAAVAYGSVARPRSTQLRSAAQHQSLVGEQAVADGEQARSSAIGRVDLGVDPFDVVTRRFRRDDEFLGDLSGRVAAGEQHEHLDLTRRQAGGTFAPAGNAMPGRGEDGIDRFAVEPPRLDLGPQLAGRVLLGAGRPIRPRLPHRLVRVGCRQNPGEPRDGTAG